MVRSGALSLCKFWMCFRTLVQCFHHSNMSSVASGQQRSVSAGDGAMQIALVVGSEGPRVRPCDLR